MCWGLQIEYKNSKNYSFSVCIFERWFVGAFSKDFTQKNGVKSLRFRCEFLLRRLQKEKQKSAFLIANTSLWMGPYILWMTAKVTCIPFSVLLLNPSLLKIELTKVMLAIRCSRKWVRVERFSAIANNDHACDYNSQFTSRVTSISEN